MNKETKTKLIITIGCFFLGIYYLLEGLDITHFGDMENDTPRFMLVFVGFIFLLVSIMVQVGKKERLNNFLASVLTFVMGLMFGWVSLFGKESGFSGNGVLISYITNLPVGRIMFGMGSIVSFIIAIIAFRMFLKPKQSKGVE